MSEPLLMGVDAGTSRVRALIFEPDGTLIAEGSDKPKVAYPQPGWASIHAEDLWKSCQTAIRSAVAQLKDRQRLRGLAVASVGEAAVPLDDQGTPLHPIIAWYDCRTEPQAQWLRQHIGEERLFEVTGLNLYPIFGLCKVLWIRENAPEQFAHITRWLNTADFLAWKLCGESATDYSLASRTFALDIRRLKYADDLLEEVGVSPALFQPLVSCGTRLGKILPEVSSATGLPSDCVVSAGGHDHFIGALVAGAITPGTLINSMGTAEALTLFRERPVDDTKIGHQGYTQGVIVVDRPYYYLVGGLFTSGGAVQWYHKLMENRYSHEELIQAARKVPPGSNGVCFMPHLRIGSPPNPAEIARGAFVGLGTDVDHSVLYRAMLEGMACDVRMIVEGMQELLEIPRIERIHCFGGESRNALLMQIKSSVMNRSLARLDIIEAVSLGGAMLGGIGAGIFRDILEALEGLKYGQEEILPEPAWVETYQRQYAEVYQGAWEQLKPLQNKLLRLYPSGAAPS